MGTVVDARSEPSRYSQKTATPQVPAGRGGQPDFPRQRIRPGQTSPPQRGSCAVVFFLDPLDFNLDGLALLVLSASFIPSVRCFHET